MMKWKTRTETTNIGVLELGNITFDEDYLEVAIDICDMSKELKAEVEKAMEIEKVRVTEEYKRFNAEHNTNRVTEWSNKPVIMDFTYLRVRLEAGKAIDYSIEFGFHDADNKSLEAFDGSVTVDLSAHIKELKKAIIKVLVDKFF